MIEIDGILYVQREQNKKPSSRLAVLASIVAATGGLMSYGNTYQRERPKVDLIEEYKLIKQKKSKLCKSDRDWVENQFNRVFKKVE